MTSAKLVITLFGEFSLVQGDKTPVHLAGDRPVSLLAYLLLHRHTAVSRQHLAFILWPDSTDSQARSNLRNLFFTLRQTLDNPDHYLTADSMRLQWRGDGAFSLDVADFEAQLADAATAAAPADKIAHLETAVSFYQGDLLPSNYDDWIIPIRERLRQSYQDALLQLMSLLAAQQEYRAATRYGQRLLQLDPLDETAYVQLMHLHANSGDRAGIRRVYETCVATLRRELDVEPAAATQAAYEQLLRLEAPVAAVQLSPSFSMPTAPTPRPLPTPATPFIGREAELAQIADLLTEADCRLITIVGPGGIGKTRLALQMAVTHQAEFPDGVAFVPLDAVTEAIHIISAIAESLNLTFSGQFDPQTQVFNFLHHKKMLLVLDNVEQLLSEIGLISELLQAAAGIVLVATSRERLNLHEEWLFSVDGLPIPQAGDTAVTENTAVRLFLHNAARLRPGFVADASDLKAICRICELVEGMPLGLELAATWVRLLSCTEIAQELEQGIDFLTAAHRNVPKRHQSLRAVFDYSWNLLTPGEQRLLTELSVFRGGFTREAAQQVASHATLRRLASLVDKSFLRPAQSGRHTIHELVRQYAAEKLLAQPELEQATAARHSAYFLQVVAGQEAALCSPLQKEVLQRFTADFKNLLLAWEWAAQHRELNGLRAASWPFWYSFELRGTYQEGEDALKRAETVLNAALTTPDGASDQQLKTLCARLQALRAFFSFRCGHNDEALEALAEALVVLRQQDDEDALADALWTQGALSWVAGQFASGADALREALTISRRFQRRWPIVVNRVFLGIVTHELGDYDEAYTLLSEGLAQAQKMGDPRPITFATSFLSRTAHTLGRTEQMIALLQAGLEQAVAANDRFAIGLSCEQLGEVALVMGQPEEAYRLFGESVAIYRDTGDKWSLSRVLNNRGDAHAQTGALALAEQDYREALATAVASETWPAALSALNGLASLWARQNSHQHVAALTTVILQHAPSPPMQAAAEALWQSAAAELTPQQQAAVRAWVGERPLFALAEDILGNKLPAA